jgi:hypothetical protein
MKPFQWQDGATVQLAATAAGAKVAFKAPLSGPIQLRIWNPGTEPVFIKRGDAGVSAALTDLPVPPGALEILTINDFSSVSHIAGITASGNVTLYITPGQGV